MQSREWLSMQYLRGLAALMVVLHHCREQFDWVKRVAPTEVGGAGVDIFFVISGFIMVYITAVKPMTAGEFLTRRFIRIAPFYWVMTALLAAIALIAPSLLRSVTFESGHFLQSLAFIPHENLEGRIRPLLSLGWTLNYEMFFYLVFALFIAMPRARRVVAIGAAFLALTVTGAAIAWRNPVWITYSDPIMLEFVFGMLLAHAVLSGVTIPKWAAALLALAGVAGFAACAGLSPENMPHRWIMFGIPAAALVAGFVWLEAAGVQFTWKLPKLVGDASYSLYLTHIFTLGALRWLWTEMLAPQDPALFTIVGTLACCAVAVLSYNLVERPIVSFLSRFALRAKPAALGRAH